MLISRNSRPCPLVALPLFCAGDMFDFAKHVSRFPNMQSQLIEVHQAAWTLYLEEAGLA